VEGGGIVLANGYIDIRKSLVSLGSGNVQACHGARYRLPKYLVGTETQKWDTSGFQGLKDKVDSFPEEIIVATINTALTELHNIVGSPLLKVAGFNGATRVPCLNKLILCVGASHMRRLTDAFALLGEKAMHVECVTFRATSQVIASIITSIRTALGSIPAEDVIILLVVLDNCTFKAQAEDGDLIPLRRDITGNYHVDGGLIVAPLESTKQMFIQLTSVFRNFPGYTFTVMTPLPRYLWGACCAEAEHAPNVNNTDHVDQMLASLTAIQRQWRGMVFRDNIQDVKIINCGAQIKDKTWWADDHVHPLPQAYQHLATNIVSGMSNQVNTADDDPSADSTLAGKRDLDKDAGCNSAQAKRAAWLTRDDTYVTRVRQPRGGFRGRGSRGGRGRWAPRGGRFGRY
jgi:hypothetical protein